MQAEVRGRDMLTGLPKTVDPLVARRCAARSTSRSAQIIDAIKSTLDKTPPELAADIMDRGIVLAGGGALLHGLDERLRHETQMPVHLAEIAAHLRRGRLGPQPRGVRGDPPQPGAKRRNNHRSQVTDSRPRRGLAYTRCVRVHTEPHRTVWRSLGSPAPRSRPPGSSSAVPPPLRRRIVAACSSLLSLVLITVYFREPAGGGLHGVQSAGATVLRPFEVGAERVARPFRDAYGWFAGLVDAKSENATLRSADRPAAPAGDPERERALQENAQLKQLSSTTSSAAALPAGLPTPSTPT